MMPRILILVFTLLVGFAVQVDAGPFGRLMGRGCSSGSCGYSSTYDANDFAQQVDQQATSDSGVRWEMAQSRSQRRSAAVAANRVARPAIRVAPQTTPTVLIKPQLSPPGSTTTTNLVKAHRQSRALEDISRIAVTH